MSQMAAAQARKPAQSAPASTGGVLQRKCRKKKPLLQREAAGPAAETVPPIVHEVLRSPGQPLDAETRAFMEPRFGHDFSRVRVHMDATAAESARAVNARAYTVGRNVVFGANQYAPGTHEGRRLITHELTHVVQQSVLRADLSGSNGVASDYGLESEAEEVADSYKNEHALVLRQIYTPSIQREEAGGGAATAPTTHRFSDEGVAVVVRSSCAPAVFGFANVETATRTALDKIFNTECIEESRRTRIQRNLTAHGLDIRCRRSANLGGACAESTGFYTPANFFTLGSESFAGHPDSNAGCQPLESTILHEIVHLVRGFAQESLPSSCEASCFGVGGGNPELCRDIDVFGRRRTP